MNLFLDTRQLTQAREDHLTCFLAACLEADDVFRRAYEAQVLAQLSDEAATPRISSIETQVSFEEQGGCRPDMMLCLEDGRHIACEHKIDAPETPGMNAEGETVRQLERYLRLSDVNFVAYFRSSPSNLESKVRDHQHYLKPASASHFLWCDLYDPLCAGQQPLTWWLREGFEWLGFTPPHPDIGKLWPDDTQEVKDNQKNFGKLWHKTRGKLDLSYRVTVDRRAGLYLTPLKPSPISLANVSPAGPSGNLLRLRVYADEARFPEVHSRLQELALGLPVPPDVVSGRQRTGQPYVDLTASLRSVLGLHADVRVYATRLYDQVVPVLDALVGEG